MKTILNKNSSKRHNLLHAPTIYTFFIISLLLTAIPQAEACSLRLHNQNTWSTYNYTITLWTEYCKGGEGAGCYWVPSGTWSSKIDHGDTQQIVHDATDMACWMTTTLAPESKSSANATISWVDTAWGKYEAGWTIKTSSDWNSILAQPTYSCTTDSDCTINFGTSLELFHYLLIPRWGI